MADFKQALKTGAACGILYGLTFLIVEDLLGYTINRLDVSAAQVGFSLLLYPTAYLLLGIIAAALIHLIPAWRSGYSQSGRILLTLAAASIIILGYRDFTQHTIYQGGPIQILIAAAWCVLIAALLFLISKLSNRLSERNPDQRAVLFTAFACALTILLILNIEVDYDPTLVAQLAGRIFLWRLVTIAFSAGIFLAVLFVAGSKKNGQSLQFPRHAPFAILSLIILVGSAITGLAIVHHQPNKPLPPEFMRRDADPPNVILTVIDALRADHLELYGYSRETMPRLTKIAREGIVFQKALAPSSWTKPSVASFFTSQHCAVCGANDKDDLLPSELVTLAETFRDHGYLTAGFSSNVFVSSAYNFDQGFRDLTYLPGHGPKKLLPPYFLYASPFSKLRENLYWIDFIGGDLAYGTASMLTEQTLSWLEWLRDVRFFLYLHYMDPHFPYFPRNRYYSAGGELSKNDLELLYKLINLKGSWDVSKDFVATMKDRYDDEIRAVDAALEELFAYLDETGLSENTLIIITSDHGEGFGEHGHFDHGHTLYQELLHVPLIVFLPGREHGGRTVSERVDLLDLAPTLYDYLDIEPQAPLEGLSLLPLIEGDEEAYRKSKSGYFAHVHPPWDDWPVDSIDALIGDRYKLIRSVPKDTTQSIQIELYDLLSDPGETVNLTDSLPDVAAALLAELHERLSYCDSLKIQPSDLPQNVLSDQDLERLRALGYVQ